MRECTADSTCPCCCAQHSDRLSGLRMYHGGSCAATCCTRAQCGDDLRCLDGVPALRRTTTVWHAATLMCNTAAAAAAPVRLFDALCVDNQGQPIRLVNGTFEGDKFRPELEAINASVTDTKGRRFPGNPLRSQGKHQATCYDEKEVHLVRITDSCPCKQVSLARCTAVITDPCSSCIMAKWSVLVFCLHATNVCSLCPPLCARHRLMLVTLQLLRWFHCLLCASDQCTQVLKEGAPGVAAGGEVRTQAWCCQANGKPYSAFLMERGE